VWVANLFSPSRTFPQISQMQFSASSWTLEMCCFIIFCVKNFLGQMWHLKGRCLVWMLSTWFLNMLLVWNFNWKEMKQFHVWHYLLSTGHFWIKNSQMNKTVHFVELTMTNLSIICYIFCFWNLCFWLLRCRSVICHFCPTVCSHLPKLT